jgi:hypothetical protein
MFENMVRKNKIKNLSECWFLIISFSFLQKRSFKTVGITGQAPGCLCLFLSPCGALVHMTISKNESADVDIKDLTRSWLCSYHMP